MNTSPAATGDQVTDFTPEDWIAENLPQGGTFAYDPWLHTSDSLKRLEQAVGRVISRS